MSLNKTVDSPDSSLARGGFFGDLLEEVNPVRR